MDLYILFEDQTDITIHHVQSVKIIGGNVLETNTFGNGPVLQRNVACWRWEGDFNDLGEPTTLGEHVAAQKRNAALILPTCCTVCGNAEDVLVKVIFKGKDQGWCQDCFSMNML